jgi:hypothetical protein
MIHVADVEGMVVVVVNELLLVFRIEKTINTAKIVMEIKNRRGIFFII